MWDASWSGDYVNENCPKDLGGHTVTIRFDDDMSLTEAVELTGFRNGMIVLEGQEHTLTDASDFGDGILRLENDLCEITVHEVTFDHDHTKYGVSVKSCPSVYFDECGFDGHATQAIETYGICAVLSTIDLSECSEANETENAEYYDSLKDYLLSKLNERLTALEQKMQAEMVKSGQIVGFAGAGAIPAGFLVCNGSAVSRTTYAGLYTAIGTTYGEGDGSTTFNVPDFRGKFLRGYLDGTSGAIGTEQTDELKSHNHGYSATADYGGDGAKIAVADGFPSETLTGTVNSTGGSETRPVNFAVQWCIKT